jgi:predicted ATPase
MTSNSNALRQDEQDNEDFFDNRNEAPYYDDQVKSKIRNFPIRLQKALAFAGFTRSTFDIETLHVLLRAVADEVSSSSSSGSSIVATTGREDELVDLLDKAVLEGLLLNCVGSQEYQFSNDRIQQAACSFLVAGQERDHVLMRIAEVLEQRGLSAVGEDWMIFTAVHHLNSLAKTSSIMDTTALVELAQLNLRVAKLSIQKADFSCAVELLRIASALLLDKETRWEEHYKLVLEIFNNLLETEFVLGNFDFSKAAIDQVLENAKSLTEKYRAHYVLVDSFDRGSNRNYTLACRKGIEILALYGVHLSVSPSKSDVIVEKRRMESAMAGKRLEDLVELPVAVDDSVTRFLAQVSSFAVLSGDDKLSRLCNIIAHRLTRLSLVDGISRHFPECCVFYATNLRKEGKHRAAYAYAEVALKMLDRFPNQGSSYIRCQIGIRSGLIHLFRHFRESLGPFLDIHRLGIADGAIGFGMVGAMHYFMCYFAIGLPLNSLLEPKLILFEEEALRYGFPSIGIVFCILRQFIENLQGKADNPTILKGKVMDEEETLRCMEDNARNMTCRDISIYRLELAYIFCDDETAAKMLEVLEDYPLFDLPILRQHTRMTYCGLAALSLGRRQKQGSEMHLKLGRRIMKEFEKPALEGSENAHPVFMCLRAEDCPSKSYYDEAIQACSNASLMHLEAMMNERCGLFLLEEIEDQKKLLAEPYLSRAMWLYNDWCATGKVYQMMQRHEFLTDARRKGSSTLSAMKVQSTLVDRHTVDSSHDDYDTSITPVHWKALIRPHSRSHRLIEQCGICRV